MGKSTEDARERNFRRASGNPFMREAQLARTRSRCAYCGRLLSAVGGSFNIHHRTYEHACSYPDPVTVDVVRVRHGEPKPGHKKTPPCERCSDEQLDAFAACLELLIPLCGGCHLREHKSLRLTLRPGGDRERGGGREETERRFREAQNELHLFEVDDMLGE